MSKDTLTTNTDPLTRPLSGLEKYLAWSPIFFILPAIFCTMMAPIIMWKGISSQLEGLFWFIVVYICGVYISVFISGIICFYRQISWICTTGLAIIAGIILLVFSPFGSGELSGLIYVPALMVVFILLVLPNGLYALRFHKTRIGRIWIGIMNGLLFCMILALAGAAYGGRYSVIQSIAMLICYPGSILLAIIMFLGYIRAILEYKHMRRGDLSHIFRR